MRTLFSDDLNRRICDESIRRFERFEDEVGQELDLRLWGYLFLLETDADAARFAADGARMLSPDGARELVPQLDVDGLVAAAFDDRAGYVTPDLVVQGYARRAAERGAHIEQSCAATRVLTDGGRVVRRRDDARHDRDRARDPHRRRLVERALRPAASSASGATCSSPRTRRRSRASCR